MVGGTSAGTYYPHGDHLGSLNVLTNSTGTEVQRLTDRPFGETHGNQGTKDFAKHRFTGQEEDPETGLYDYHARYYNPVLQRDVTRHPLLPHRAPRPFIIAIEAYEPNGEMGRGHFVVASIGIPC